jgi:hypothetical protein
VIGEHRPGALTLDVVPDQAEFDAFQRRLGWRKLVLHSPWATPSAFVCMLAKIAHCYAVAEVGIGAFRPALVPYIFSEADGIQYFVGGFEPQLPQEKSPLTWRIQEVGGQRWIIVTISLRLFAFLPQYQVACGVLM